MIHTVKGFGIVNKAEIGVFLELSCFFHDPADVGNLSLVQFSSVAQSRQTLCNPMNCSTPGPPVHHQLPEFTQIYVHQVGDAIQPSHLLSSPSPPAPNPSQHQSLIQCIVAVLVCIPTNSVRGFLFLFTLSNIYFVDFLIAAILEIQPVHSEGDQPWDFFGRNDAKAETPVLWPPHAKS